MSGEIKSINNWLIERGYDPGEEMGEGPDDTLHDLLWAFFCHLEEEARCDS